MLCGADDEIFEITKRILTQNIAFVARDVPANRSFSGEHIKVILPKIDHRFLQLLFRINCSQDTIRRDLRQYLLGRTQVILLIQLAELCLTLLPVLFGHVLAILCRLRLAAFAIDSLQECSGIRIFGKKLGGSQVKYLKIFDLRLKCNIGQ